MTRRRALAAALVVMGALCGSSPAMAKVGALSAGGFVVEHEGVSKATPRALWARLIKPSLWWNKDHSWSGDARNLRLDARPGGCFCEALPGGGGVVHATVIHLKPMALLRLSGALGPLQEQALTGTLTIELKPADGGGTRVRFAYAVAGSAAFPPESIARGVDAMIGEQHQRLLDLADRM